MGGVEGLRAVDCEISRARGLPFFSGDVACWCHPVSIGVPGVYKAVAAMLPPAQP